MQITAQEQQLILVFAIPLLAALVAALVPWRNVRDGLVIAVAGAGFINMYQILKAFLGEGSVPSAEVVEVVSGLWIAFKLEPLGMIFALIVSFLWIVSTVYSIGYMRGNSEAHQNRFYAFFALAIFSALGIAFAGNLFTLFIFYEVLTLSTYPLVTHSGTRDALKGGRTYLGILLTTSLLLLLPAILYTFFAAGTLDFVAGGILRDNVVGPMVGVLLAMYMFGIGKAALMPFHRWLPAAMVAPTPVSALLHAVAVVKAGVFCIVKVVVYVFGVDYLKETIQQNWWHGGWLVWVAGFTIIAASITALHQDNLKKRLAYSTVSQLSYVILAVAILSPKAVVAAAFHIAAHAFGKITLFFAAGSIYTSAHKTKVSQLSGVGRQMPWTMIAFTIGALSMIGVPPAVGFISKWYMLTGAFTGELYVVVGILIVSTVLNAAYFLPIVYKAFFEKVPSATGITISRKYGEAPLPIVIALVITASATLVLFFAPGVFMELALKVG